MSKFNDFMKEIEAEAHTEGPQAVAHFEALKRHYSNVRTEINQESNSLLIYDWCPEKMGLYLIPNSVITIEHRSFLFEANNKMVNSDEINDGMSFLCAALEENKEYVDEKWKEEASIYCQYKIDLNKLPYLYFSISKVYLSGFIL